MSKKPSRLAALKSRLVDSIKPGSLAKIEKLVDEKLSISATPAEVTNLLFAIANNHPKDFNAGPKRGLRNQPEDPAGVNHLQDVFHGRPDFKAMTPEERLNWVEANPAYAQALLWASQGRKSND